MIKIDVNSLAEKLDSILNSVEHGEHVLLTRDGLPIAKVTGPGVAMKPGFGGAKDLITLTEDFDAPLADFAEYSQPRAQTDSSRE